MAKVLLIPALVLLSLAVACFFGTASPVAPADQITFVNQGEIHTLDPAGMSWNQDIRVAMGLWEGLATYDPVTLKPAPGVAERWEVSADGLTYTFHLRPEAEWSDGSAVTARDFIFAWTRSLRPKAAAQYLDMFFNIAGAQAYADYYSGSVSAGPPPALGISAAGPHTLVVHLAHPCPYFLDLVAFPPFYPLNRDAMKPFLMSADAKDPHPDDAAYDPGFTRPPHLVTEGPYRLAEWVFRRHLLLEPNPHYWDRAAVHTRRLKVVAFDDDTSAFMAYHTHAVDILSFTPQEELGQALVRQKLAGLRDDVSYRPVFGTYYYIFNCSKPPFNDARVRKALALAVNKQEIVDRVTGMHQAAVNVLVPQNAVPGYASPAGLSYDPAAAKRLLADAGYPDGRGFPDVEFLANAEVPVHNNIAQAVRQMWQQTLGLRVTVRAEESKSFHTDRIHQNFQIARGGWYGDYLDPTTFLDLARTGNPNNDGLFSDRAFDHLMQQSDQEPDSGKRFALLQKAERALVEQEFPFIPLFQYGDGLMYDPAKFTGLSPNVRLLTQFKYLARK